LSTALYKRDVAYFCQKCRETQTNFRFPKNSCPDAEITLSELPDDFTLFRR